MNNRYICIHGHFYQPPRENPWLEAIEFQESAYPYRNWNERINAECYAPNAASRIIGSNGKVAMIGNNYAKISFNFGPTLLSWMEHNANDTYRAILEADRLSRERFGGHGSAIAQAYSHMILPLASSRDKYTQITWGIRDFQYRFDRYPEGMWLPETAVDTESLEIMAELGIQYTILSPYQAQHVRRIGDTEWLPSDGGRIDPRMPYRCGLPSGKAIAIFFYDGPIARDIAFGGALKRGEALAERLLRAFAADNGGPQLVHVATDGETYGHHHQFGDMALAYCLHYIESNNLARITNYGEYLTLFPPDHEVRVFERSSWSCAHGVGRWYTDCGCNSGMHPGWKQNWRQPLRETLDWFRDAVTTIFEQELHKYLVDAWMARNDYIEPVLDRTPDAVERFLKRHAARELSTPEKIRAMKLLEMSRHAMLMYTSCGWFFDELSGIETVQVIRYASRALQLAEDVFGMKLEESFLKRLEQAPTNMPEFRNGAEIYNRFVKPARVDFLRVGAHYAIAALFNEYPETTDIYCYRAVTDIYDKKVVGKSRLFVCRAIITSKITMESARIEAAVIYLGDHNINAGVRYYEENIPSDHSSSVVDAFVEGDILEVIRLMDRAFASNNYSIGSLFREEQFRILKKILDPTMQQIDHALHEACEINCLVIDFFKALNLPIPRNLLNIITYRVNVDLESSFDDGLNVPSFEKLLYEVKRWNLDIDRPKIGLLASRWINKSMERISADPGTTELISGITRVLSLLKAAGIQLNLWAAQNRYYFLEQDLHMHMDTRADAGEAACSVWLESFHALGNELNLE